jgi:hypothetical protein
MKADLLPGERVGRFDGPSRCDGWRKRSIERSSQTDRVAAP